MSVTKLANLWAPLVTVYNRAVALYRERHPDAPQPILTCTFRSSEEQQRLYNQGRTAPGSIVTNAMPGQSLHNYPKAFAFDVAFQRPNGSLDWDVKHFRNFNAIVQEFAPWVKWGGEFVSFKDYPHFEVRGYSWRDAKAGIVPKFT